MDARNLSESKRIAKRLPSECDECFNWIIYSEDAYGIWAECDCDCGYVS